MPGQVFCLHHKRRPWRACATGVASLFTRTIRCPLQEGERRGSGGEKKRNKHWPEFLSLIVKE